MAGGTGTEDFMQSRKEMSLTDRISADFTTVAWVLIPIAVGINVVGGFVVDVLRIPLFLDVIGTVMIAMLAGAWVAIVAGVLTNIVLGFITAPTIIPFGIVQAAIAIVVGLMAVRGWFYIEESVDYAYVAVAGIVVALVAAIISTPLVVAIFGGLTGSPADVITGFLLASGADIYASVFGREIIIESADKISSVVIAYLIAISIPERYRPSFGRSALN